MSNLLKIRDVDRMLQDLIEGFGMKIQLRVGEDVKWVAPAVLLKPRGNYSTVGHDPEIRIRSGSLIDENYMAQPTPSVVKRPLEGDPTKLEIFTKYSTQLAYFYVIEHLTRDSVVDSWLKEEFFTRFRRENSYPVKSQGGKKYWVWFIREAITDLSGEEAFRVAYRFRAVLNLERIERKVATANRRIQINVVDPNRRSVETHVEEC